MYVMGVIRYFNELVTSKMRVKKDKTKNEYHKGEAIFNSNHRACDMRDTLHVIFYGKILI